MSDQAFLKQLFADDTIYSFDEVTKNQSEENTEAEINEVEKEPIEDVSIENTVAEEPVSMQQPIKFKGNNAKRIAILVNDLGAEFINDTDLALLTKILSAIKLTIDDVAIINSANQNSIDKESILEHGDKVINFDPTFSIAEGDLYTSINSENKVILKSQPLAAIANDVEQKKALWQALQIIFA